ncbi:unnamed protein product [Amaranthus hypochondriacus]
MMNSHIRDYVAEVIRNSVIQEVENHVDTICILHFNQFNGSVDNIAYKSYRARLKGQSNNTTLLFKQIKCAQQPGGRECGYYVMRFMYEIVKQYSQCMGDLQQEYILQDQAHIAKMK